MDGQCSDAAHVWLYVGGDVMQLLLSEHNVELWQEQQQLYESAIDQVDWRLFDELLGQTQKTIDCKLPISGQCTEYFATRSLHWLDRRRLKRALIQKSMAALSAYQVTQTPTLMGAVYWSLSSSQQQLIHRIERKHPLRFSSELLGLQKAACDNTSLSVVGVLSCFEQKWYLSYSVDKVCVLQQSLAEGVGMRLETLSYWLEQCINQLEAILLPLNLSLNTSVLQVHASAQLSTEQSTWLQSFAIKQGLALASLEPSSELSESDLVSVYCHKHQIKNRYYLASSVLFACSVLSAVGVVYSSAQVTAAQASLALQESIWQGNASKRAHLQQMKAYDLTMQAIETWQAPKLKAAEFLSALSLGVQEERAVSFEKIQWHRDKNATWQWQAHLQLYSAELSTFGVKQQRQNKLLAQFERHGLTQLTLAQAAQTSWQLAHHDTNTDYDLHFAGAWHGRRE